MPVTVRFAPSPTGYIHIGNARTALLNWFFAQKNKGRFLLRFDDTDTLRSRAEYAEAIKEDLHWIGITPDICVAQSTRLERYHAVFEMLKEKGVLYPCYETAEELERKRKRQRARGLPPVYDRQALKLTDPEKAQFAKEGRRAHWRFLLPNFRESPFSREPTMISWDDLCRGKQSIDISSLSDPVLVREDGSYLYTLPSVIDDCDMNVTHVIRGEDHIVNTAVQHVLFDALQNAPPAFAHHNLLSRSDGEGLSKRSGALSLRQLRAEGIEPEAVATMASLLGTSQALSPLVSFSKIQDKSSLSDISKASTRFDHKELLALNARLLTLMPYASLAKRFDDWGIDGGEAFWHGVRDNVSIAQDARDWWDIAQTDTLTLSPEASSFLQDKKSYLRDALDALPAAPWSQETWALWTNNLKKKTGRRGRDLFLPLRCALTGRLSGPEMAGFLPFIGYARCVQRLEKRLENCE